MPTSGKVHRFVLVCDGAKALILADGGIAPQPKLSVVESFSEPHAATGALGTDRPGRVHESAGVARSAMEQTDFHAAEEAAFLGRIADRLAEMMEAPGAPSLLIVAPPRALGVLRDLLSPAVRARVTGEIAKDLVKLPVDQIERHIAA